MVRQPLERKPKLLPWVVGLAALALFMWAIAALLDPADATEEPVEQSRLEAELQGDDAEAAVDVTDLLPFGPEDRGREVEIVGDPVGSPAAEGVWVRTGDRVVFVRSTRTFEPDAEVRATGILERATGASVTTWIQQAGLPDLPGFERLTVEKGFVVRADGAES